MSDSSMTTLLNVWMSDSKKPVTYSINCDEDEFDQAVDVAQETGLLRFMTDDGENVVINVDYIHRFEFIDDVLPSEN